MILEKSFMLKTIMFIFVVVVGKLFFQDSVVIRKVKRTAFI